MNQIDTMKLALETLEYWDVHGKLHQPTEEAITALREALEEQPERPYRQLQDNGSKYFGESWDKAEQPAQGCGHCNHALYSGTKCKNCGRVTEQAAIKRDLTPVQPARQEPLVTKTEKGIVLHVGWDDLPVGAKLYTSPQPAQRTWVGLTDEEILEVLCIWPDHDDDPDDYMEDIREARAIEAKLREKNT